jgi:hypothetical protein
MVLPFHQAPTSQTQGLELIARDVPIASGMVSLASSCSLLKGVPSMPQPSRPDMPQNANTSETSEVTSPMPTRSTRRGFDLRCLNLRCRAVGYIWVDVDDLTGSYETNILARCSSCEREWTHQELRHLMEAVPRWKAFLDWLAAAAVEK